MAAINGTLNAVTYDGTEIVHHKSATLTVTNATADASTKDSSGWAAHINGQRDWSITADGLYDTDGATSPDILLGYIIARTADVTMQFTTDSPGNVAGWEGTGTIVDIAITGSMEAAMTYSMTIKGNGALAAI